MEKAGVRTRDIQFFSGKNNRMICVHSRSARDYAKYLEVQSWVDSYETCVPLDREFFQHIDPVDIRKEYLEIDWTTDFLIHTANGRIEVREFVDCNDFSKRAVLERIELSRRYWISKDIADWKLVIGGSFIPKSKGGQI